MYWFRARGCSADGTWGPFGDGYRHCPPPPEVQARLPGYDKLQTIAAWPCTDEAGHSWGWSGGPYPVGYPDGMYVCSRCGAGLAQSAHVWGQR